MNNNQIHTIEVKRMGFYLKGDQGVSWGFLPPRPMPRGLDQASRGYRRCGRAGDEEEKPKARERVGLRKR